MNNPKRTTANQNVEAPEPVNEILNRINSILDSYPTLTVGEVLMVAETFISNILASGDSVEQILKLSHELHDSIVYHTGGILSLRAERPDEEIPGGNEEVIN